MIDVAQLYVTQKEASELAKSHSNHKNKNGSGVGNGLGNGAGKVASSDGGLSNYGHFGKESHTDAANPPAYLQASGGGGGAGGRDDEEEDIEEKEKDMDATEDEKALFKKSMLINKKNGDADPGVADPGDADPDDLSLAGSDEIVGRSDHGSSTVGEGRKDWWYGNGEG